MLRAAHALEGRREARVQICERIVGGVPNPARIGIPDRDLVPLQRPNLLRATAQKAVTRPLLAPHDRFQEETEPPIPQLVIGGNGRIGVEEEFGPDRNAGTGRGQRAEGLEGGFDVQ